MRRDSALAPAYRKDPSDEAFLRNLNTALGEQERAGYDHDLPELYPTFHVLGAPRTGTTLLVQLVASNLNIGCINNLIAAFWEAPCCGIRLSRKLLGDQPLRSSYQSNYGRTASIAEPHEFGYFWANVLRREDLAAPSIEEKKKIDWQLVATILNNMSFSYGRPIIFKSFMASWCIPELLDRMPKSCFLWMRRDPVDVAISLLHMRRRYAARPDEWVSVKPPEYEFLKDEPLHRQVAGQAVFIDRHINRAVTEIGRRNVLEIAYETLCRRPQDVLESVRELATANGYPAERIAECPSRLDAVRRSRDLTEAERNLEWHVQDLLAHHCGAG
jgi:hypothetical protein